MPPLGVTSGDMDRFGYLEGGPRPSFRCFAGDMDRFGYLKGGPRLSFRCLARKCAIVRPDPARNRREIAHL